eukprot:751842-Pyramimonas_sp.AAC.1
MAPPPHPKLKTPSGSLSASPARIQPVALAPSGPHPTYYVALRLTHAEDRLRSAPAKCGAGNSLSGRRAGNLRGPTLRRRTALKSSSQLPSKLVHGGSYVSFAPPPPIFILGWRIFSVGSLLYGACVLSQPVAIQV